MALDAGLPVYRYETLDSTSTECRRRYAAGERRCLVLTNAQTAGRGRSGKRFYSPAGAGLYMSLLFPTPAEKLEGLTPYAAVCAAGAVETLTGCECGIKWVNDLFFEGKKVCGILAERLGECAILGIGINLTPAAVPEELRDIMGCLGWTGEREPLAEEIANGLLAWPVKDTAFMEEYRRRSVVLGRRVRFNRRQDGAETEGIAVGIGDDGALMIDTGAERVVLRSGEISLCSVEGLKLPGRTQ